MSACQVCDRGHDLNEYLIWLNKGEIKNKQW